MIAPENNALSQNPPKVSAHENILLIHVYENRIVFVSQRPDVFEESPNVFGSRNPRFLTQGINSHIRGQRVPSLFQANYMHRFRAFRQFPNPGVEKSQHWVIEVHCLRDYQESHIDVITGMYIICASPRKVPRRVLSLWGPFLSIFQFIA